MSHLKNKVWIPVLLLIVFLLPAKAETAEKEPFNPSEFIIGHISDAYNWHITTVGHTDVSIPLPVIVRSTQRGWFVFSAAKLEHGHASYEGFSLSLSGKHKGKIVEIIPGKGEMRPIDLSITKNVASLLISAALICFIFLSLARHYKKAPMASPKGFQGAMEVVVVFIQNEVIKPCIGKDYLRYSPYLLTLFFFILTNNVLGIIPLFPGGANLTGNIAVTFVLALCTFIAVNVFATKEYWKDIFFVPGVPLWLKIPIPMMPFLELVGVFSKPVALMIRLFANILAGHMIAMVFMALIFVFGSVSPIAGSGVSILSVAFAIFMNFLEILVIFIQAYVFTLLSSVFIGLSRIEPHKAH